MAKKSGSNTAKNSHLSSPLPNGKGSKKGRGRGKPFEAGKGKDQRINRNGRPKDFTALRALARDIAIETAKSKDEKPVMIGDKTVSITELILLSWATSGDFQRQKHFFEIAYGKVPEEMNLIGTLDFNFDAWKKKSQERLKKVQALED